MSKCSSLIVVITVNCITILMLGAICGSAQSMDCADPQIAPNINMSDKMLAGMGMCFHLFNIPVVFEHLLAIFWT